MGAGGTREGPDFEPEEEAEARAGSDDPAASDRCDAAGAAPGAAVAAAAAATRTAEAAADGTPVPGDLTAAPALAATSPAPPPPLAAERRPPLPGDDAATVAALTGLLLEHGGHRPASAVGYLYGSKAACPHRLAIRRHGGVAGFVAAHSGTFALEPPPWPGGGCPWIRLLTEEERLLHAATLGPRFDVAARIPCRFFSTGQCLKGDRCRFSHEPATPPEPEPEAGEDEEALIRSQVLFYLSDENLLRDVFFQSIIAGSPEGWVEFSTLLSCPRMKQLGATPAALLAALGGAQGLELREGPPGCEAVRRTQPPPCLAPWAQAPKDVVEASLREWPLELLRDRASGWEPVVEDEARRSWCYRRRRSWPAEVLQEELERLRSGVNWQALHSRQGQVTRSTAWFVSGACRCCYSYGDVVVHPRTRPEWFDRIEARVLGEGCGLEPDEWPDSVNLNLYEHEGQNVGWHSDDETLFGGCVQDCCIISASWGAPRSFEVAVKDFGHASGKPSVFKETVRSVVLNAGDVLSMEGLFQRHYSHQLAKGATSLQEPPPSMLRVNLTWRYIAQHKPYCPLAFVHAAGGHCMW